MKIVLYPLACLPFVLTACGGGGGGPTVANGTLPIAPVDGQLIAVQLGAQQTTQSGAGGETLYNTSATEVQASQRTSVASPIEFTASVDEDPARTPDSFGSASRAYGFIDVDFTGQLAGVGGTPAEFTDLTDQAGSVYFENGNFGDPESSTSAQTQLQAVGVFNPAPIGSDQIVLSDVTTLRVESFDSGTNEGVFGVGFAGNYTQNMPTTGTATYRAFVENGVTRYNSSSGLRIMGLTDPANRGAAIEIDADFAASTVNIDLNGLQLLGQNAAGTAEIVLNPDVDGLIATGAITGNTFTGTDARFVNAADAEVGTRIGSQMIGGFFGDAADELASVVIIEGAMNIDDGTGTASRDYIYSVTYGGERQ
ncbi:transferrin-binding protein-like solute binding protein [Roseobacter sp. HKCCA0434]|uniref:transferrin-binding protein-like solute binding protein n=1 Tax=Roseobacter sp. HKCCA0434 TaxID=3079297 RepID=UPI002905A2FB|nr:transferrin-binding protein-like solute binding protein [Roseobacter sp. HKCCA0434]